MRYCPRCDNTRWICENHLGKPFAGEWACNCGAAGMPCPDCNKIDPSDPADVPAMSKHFKPGLD